MATNFPTSLDSLTNPTASDKLNSVTVPHASKHADIYDPVADEFVAPPEPTDPEAP